VADLYRAVQNYVTILGGNVVVIGGVDVIELPDDGKAKFRVAVRCLGIKPKYAERAASTGDSDRD
jgi:hypothetical protein